MTSTPIGTAVLQIIPSLDGVEAAINKQLDGKLRATGKKGGKQLAKGVGEGLKDLEREVDSAAKSYNKLRDKAADALGKVRVEEEKLAKVRSSGKSDQIVAAEERRNKALRDSTRAVKDARDGHALLVSSQKRLAAGADDTGRKLGSLGASMRHVGTIAGGAALAGITALAAGVVIAGRELYQLGAQFDDLNDTIQVKTGLSGAALDKLTASVEKLGTTNVPSSFADIGNVAAEVTRNLHLTDSEFDAVTSRLANLQRMGVDVDVRALGKAFRGFGVDAKNQAPALNSLYEASTKSGLSIDDLLAAVIKGGPALRQFGFDFGESAALVASFEDAGLDGEKGMAALTKAFAYFSKEGIPAEQGLRDIIGRIQQLGDTPEAGELANKVFGAKGGAAFLEAIQTGALDLESLSSALQSTGLDINQVSDDTADWSEKWQDLKNEIAVALEPLASTVFDQANTGLDNLAEQVKAHKNDIIDFFIASGEGAISFAQVSTNAFAGLVKFLELLDTVVMKTLGWLPGYDDKAAQEFHDSISKLSDAMDSAASSGVWDDLRDQLHEIGEEAKTAGGNSDGLSDSIGDVGSSAGNAGPQVKQLRDALKDLSTVAPPMMPWWTSRPGTPGSATPGQNPLDVFAPTGPGFTIGGAPGPPALGGGGGGMPLAGESARDFAHRARKPLFESQGLIVGDHEADQYGEHQNGALDIMVPDIATGNRVLQQVLADPNTYGAIFNGKAYGYGQGMSPRPYTGPNPHTDHVHVWYKPGGAGASSGAATTGTPPRASMDTGQRVVAASNSAGFPGSTALNNAFGAGYEPGIGTPGTNEYGEPGYYRPDPKDVREVQQRIDDQMERIREADEVARQAQVAIDDLEVDADQAEKDAAQERKRKADYDAKVARRELDDLQGELGEAQKGAFSPAKEALKSKSGKGSDAPGFSFPSSFSGFGSAIGEFVGGQISSGLSVFGVPDSPGWLKGLSTFIGGISVSDAAGNTLFDGGNMLGGDSSPLAASQTFGAPPLIEGNVHGTRAGQQPGPGVVYNITARDTEDAFIRAQRLERERAAAKLSRY